jgi:hypothetical protein
METKQRIINDYAKYIHFQTEPVVWPLSCDIAIRTALQVIHSSW